MNPAVVVLAYNRPAALQRLLDSVANASYPRADVPLVLSLDAGGHPDVGRLAAEFSWIHGPKQVLMREQHLGLVGHFHHAGALSREYGAIILLEDDQVVARSYYSYAIGALRYYADDNRIAGHCLSALPRNGYNQLPFVPVLDGTDAYFLQVPFYVGQAFTAGQWARYEAWRVTARPTPAPGDALHPLLAGFGADEWFPERLRYLAETSRFYVFPREARCTGFGDAGTHFARPSRWFQVPLQPEDVPVRFVPLDASTAVYDTYFEILPDRLRRLAPHLDPRPCDVDFYGSKPAGAFRHELVLTSRHSRAPLASFGREMWPQEANVQHRIPGDDIVLSRVDDLLWGRAEEVRLTRVLADYFGHGQRPSLRRAIRDRVAGWFTQA